MCGIAGIVTLTGRDPERGSAARMRDRIQHRGPDGNGEFEGPGIALAACRLAIVDLDQRGLMPMASADGRYRIVHNGEIYNRPELREDLARRGVTLRTTTDTEVLLQLYALDGPAMLDRLDGMFAFAIWDAQMRELFVARDRVGEKPFFYAEHEGRLYFASEPKALFAAGVPCQFDNATWSELLTFGATAGPRTPYVGVRRLLGGEWLRVANSQVTVGRWWRFPTQREARVRRFGDLLAESVERRLIADVPVGTLLSGGLDSSSVTALAQTGTGHRLPAFTVRYTDPDADEGEYATAAATFTGADQHELYVSDEELPQLLADAAWHLDEPMFFNATAELLAVSRFARRHVRVLLTGESADELLGGYGRFRQYRYLPWLRLAATVMRPVRGRFQRGSRWYRLSHGATLKRADWIAATYANGDPARFDKRPLAEWAPYRAHAAEQSIAAYSDPALQALAYERQTHLPTVLDNSDRLTMGAPLEARLPFTSIDLLAFAGSAKRSELFRGAHGKQPLRLAMAGKLPPLVLNRRKRGWTSPYQRYLRTSPPLRDWLTGVPRHPIVAQNRRWSQAEDVIRRFLDGDDHAARDAWMLGRIVLWHEVCVEGDRQPFRTRA
ncbi:MAG TPA: asparagine synthase (glutamine-hydrolyzing) [Candidatus Limnocylindrales bacterium]